MNVRVLYVEDNPQNMRVVRKYLTMVGCQMLEADNGLAGVETAERELPDVILMDINLPDISGMEATSRIKANPVTAHIPIIALTANAMYGDRERFLAGGCDSYLAKPVLYQELVNTLRMFVGDKIAVR